MPKEIYMTVSMKPTFWRVVLFLVFDHLGWDWAKWRVLKLEVK